MILSKKNKISVLPPSRVSNFSDTEIAGKVVIFYSRWKLTLKTCMQCPGSLRTRKLWEGNQNFEFLEMETRPPGRSFNKFGIQ